MDLRTVGLTALSLLAFAGNSLLCRLAIGGGTIDAASFTLARFGSGALVLVALSAIGGRRLEGSWQAAGWLALYAGCFSFAYTALSAGTGALLLFASVQGTMIAAGLAAGERPRAAEWLGLGLALAGLAVLVAPGLAAPSPVGAGLMVLSGVGWGRYSLAGRGAADPIAATTGNFVRVVPMVALLAAVSAPWAHVDPAGVGWAVASGGLASGLGYVLWYTALRGLSATTAAIVQLAVPLIAAVGGIVLLHEAPSARLAVASVAILGGVGLAVVRRRAPAR